MKKHLSLLLTTVIAFLCCISFYGCTIKSEPLSENECLIKVLKTTGDILKVEFQLPKAARLTVYKQNNYYNNEVMLSDSQSDFSDSHSKFVYSLKGDFFTYKIHYEGKITKAGYLNMQSSSYEKRFSFKSVEDPKIRYDYTTSELKSGAKFYYEDSLMLNVNNQNYLKLDLNETFVLRPYRAAWEIIDNTSSNVILHPDYNFNILQGDSVIVEKKDNTALLTAVKEGVTLFEVSYDAIQVLNHQNNETVLYGATDKNRTALLTVNVTCKGESTISLNTDWDSEFDTFYFTRSDELFPFSPVCSSPLTVKINGNLILPDANLYLLPIREGNNWVEILSEDGYAEYFTIRGAKIEYIVNNLNGNSTVKPGDKIQVFTKGLYMPLPKLCGIYNPNPMNSVRLYFQSGVNGIESNKCQYNFINKNLIDLTAGSEDIVLTGGNIKVNFFGLKLGAHRTLTDTGFVFEGFNHPESAAAFCRLPDLTIKVVSLS